MERTTSTPHQPNAPNAYNAPLLGFPQLTHLAVCKITAGTVAAVRSAKVIESTGLAIP